MHYNEYYHVLIQSTYHLSIEEGVITHLQNYMVQIPGYYLHQMSKPKSLFKVNKGAHYLKAQLVHSLMCYLPFTYKNVINMNRISAKG